MTSRALLFLVGIVISIACDGALAQQVPDELLAAIDSAVNAPTVKMDTADTALRVMRRKLKDADVYLFFNEGALASKHSVTLMSRGRTADTWDPQNGTVSALTVKSDGGHPVVQLDLQPYETRLIVVR
jgi:hypothetical protein